MRDINRSASAHKLRNSDTGKTQTAREYIMGMFDKGINRWEKTGNGVKLFFPGGSSVRITDKISKDFLFFMLGESTEIFKGI